MSSASDKINFLKKVFGPCEPGSDGLNVATCCPNPKCSTHGVLSKKKLVIRIDTESFHCWVCDLKGRTLQTVLKKYYPAHLGEYVDKFSKTKITDIQSVVDEEPVTIPEGFKLLALHTDAKDPDIKDVIKYARQRNLSERDFWYFKLGTCTGGKFRRRLIIPSFNFDGELNYFVARAIDEKFSNMKYLNAKVSKKNVIFNEINIDWQQELTLVEGPMDLTKCDNNAACLLGSHISEEYALFQQIIRYKTPIVFALDADMKTKTQQYCKLLSSYGVQVRVLDLLERKDVGEMSKAEFLQAKKDAKPWFPNDRLFHLISSIKSGSLL